MFGVVMLSNSFIHSKKAFFWSKVRKWSRKHYISTALLITLPSLWFIIVPMFPTVFTDDNNAYYCWVNIISVICVVVIIALSVVRACVNHHTVNKLKSERDERKYTEKLYSTILDSLGTIVAHKRRNFSKMMSLAKDDVFLEITKAEEQLQLIIEQLSVLFVTLFKDFRREDIHIALLSNVSGKPTDSNAWEKIADANTNPQTDLKKLFADKTSAVRKAYDTERIIFYADKNTALRERSYILTQQDDAMSDGKQGSIICVPIKIGEDKKKAAVAVLCISTYRYQLCEENDTLMKEVIIENILPPFVCRIQIELSLLYMRRQKEKKLKIKTR